VVIESTGFLGVFWLVLLFFSVGIAALMLTMMVRWSMHRGSLECSEGRREVARVADRCLAILDIAVSSSRQAIDADHLLLHRHNKTGLEKVCHVLQLCRQPIREGELSASASIGFILLTK